MVGLSTPPGRLASHGANRVYPDRARHTRVARRSRVTRKWDPTARPGRVSPGSGRTPLAPSFRLRSILRNLNRAGLSLPRLGRQTTTTEPSCHRLSSLRFTSQLGSAMPSLASLGAFSSATDSDPPKLLGARPFSTAPRASRRAFGPLRTERLRFRRLAGGLPGRSSTRNERRRVLPAH